MNEILPVIENFGFPIVITLFLLIRFEKSISKLSESISELITIIKYKENVVSKKEGE